jgi:hypothetical protein
MKKLFENDIFHYTFVLTVVALACGLVIGGVHAITNPIIQENAMREQIEAYQAVLPELDEYEELDTADDPSTITDKVLGKDSSGNTVGYIFVAEGRNSYGSMRMVVSIDGSGEIVGAQFTAIEQSLNMEGTRNNLQSFVGSSIFSLEPTGDIVSGVTGSYNTLLSLLEDIATSYTDLGIEPPDEEFDLYETFFGDAFGRSETDEDFEPTEYVKSKETVYDTEDAVIGDLYELEGVGEYEGYDGMTEGSMTIYVLLDDDNTILDIIAPEDDYGHTLSFGQSGGVFDYIETFKGETLDSPSDDDLTSGATWSKEFVNVLIRALNEVVE